MKNKKQDINKKELIKAIRKTQKILSKIDLEEKSKVYNEEKTGEIYDNLFEILSIVKKVPADVLMEYYL